LYNPKILKDCAELKKLRRLPTRAIPSEPTKIAMNFEVKKPAIIFIITEAELSEATFTKTLLLMYLSTFFN